MERFWSKVRVGGPDECWLWTAGLDGGGYGTFKLNRKTVGAHKVAYGLLIGEVPPGLVLDHFECDTRTCVNPRHLRPTTHRENILRGCGLAPIELAKSECPRGHEYGGGNLYIYRGKRNCRACHRMASFNYRKRQRVSHS